MKSTLIAFFLFCSVSVFGQGFTLKLKVENQKSSKFSLVYFQNDNFVVDSTAVYSDGWIVFKGRVDEPVVANIIVSNNENLEIKTEDGIIPGPGLRLFLSNEVIEVCGDANTFYAATVSGGQTNAEWGSVKYEQAVLEGANWLSMKKYYANMGKLSDQEGKVFSTAFELNESLSNELRNQYIKSNPSSLVTLFYLTEMMYAELTLDELKSMYANIKDELKSHSYGVRVADMIKALGKTANGQKAINFERTTYTGEKFNLDLLSGKYVLLDFWGSWCAPCRESHPHLLSLYNKYKDKGLEIVAVAQESSKDLNKAQATWKKAIEDDKLIYINVLNNDGIESMDIVSEYGISGFPTKVLLDKDGMVLGRWLGEDVNLDEKLKEIFGF